MAQVYDIISRAARLAGILGKGETMDSDEAADALASLNGMLKGWSLDNNLLPEYTQRTFTLQPGVNTYSIGVGLTFNAPAPIALAQPLAGHVVYNGQRTPLRGVRDSDIEAQPVDNNGTIPLVVSYMTNAAGIGTVHFWPTPQISTTVQLNCVDYITTYATTGDTWNMPDGYEEVVVWNLAVRLVPEYEKAGINPFVVQEAARLLTALSVSNSPTAPSIALNPLLGANGRLPYASQVINPVLTKLF